jgi:hypothetical protein
MLSMKTEYYTVQSDHPETLDELVNGKLAQGRELQGGVSVRVVKAPVTSPGDEDFWYTYAQATVRRTEEPNESEGAYV